MQLASGLRLWHNSFHGSSVEPASLARRSTMQITLRGVLELAGVLSAAVLTPSASAQVPVRPVPGYSSASYPRQAFVTVTGSTNIGVQTTVTAPDRGGVTVGGYSRLSQGRTEFGVPVLGRVPYGGRGWGNVGYGRSAVYGRVSVQVRVIDLREEEFRQTGYRSP